MLVLERSIYGGQVTNTPTVENYPGILNISGVDLAMALYEQVTGLGIEVRLEEPVSYQLDAPAKAVATARGLYEAKAVIVANGVKRRTLGCPGEERLAGRGVSYCATCDGAFFQGAEVAIVGGGNTALEDALFLSNNCAAVHLIHRRDQFRGQDADVQVVKSRENIELALNSQVTALHGEPLLTGVTLTNKDGTTRELSIAGLFVAVGQEPDNQVFADLVDLDEAGYIVAGEDCLTKTSGVFTAGDCRTKTLRQLTTAAADGSVAATAACRFVDGQA